MSLNGRESAQMSLNNTKGAWMSLNELKRALISSNEFKWAQISLNEPKQTQETLNIFKIILYELKMALNFKYISLQMSGKEPKWLQMALNQLISQ